MSMHNKGQEDQPRVTRRSLVQSSLAATAVSVLGGSAARAAFEPSQPGKVYKFRMQSIYSPAETGFKGALTTFVERVKRMSGNRIEIELFSGGTLVPSAEITVAVSRGIIDMGSSSAAYISGLESVPFAFQIPQGPRSADDVMMIWEKGVGDLTSAAYDRQGVKLLGMMIVSDIPLYTREPITTLDDFAGLKVRTNPVVAVFTEQLGAANVFIPGGEVYLALSNGTVDAATWGSFSTTIDKKWYEVAKYVLQPSLVYAFQNDDITINKDLFESLPPDLQAVLESAARVATWELYLGNMLANDAAWKTMEAAGVEITRLPPEDVAEMAEAAKVCWDNLAGRGKDAYAAMKITTDYLRSRDYTDYDITTRAITVNE